ncbi:MAG: ATP-binding protein [Stenotrophobium sp.]
MDRLSNTQHGTQKREVMAELMGMHARIIRLLPFLDALILCGIAYDVHPFVPRKTLILWLCAVMSMETVRGVYSAYIYRRRGRIDPYLTHACFIVLAGISGFSIGILPVLFFPYLPVAHLPMMAAILYAYAAGGIGVAASPQIEITWSICVVMPISYAYGLLHPEQAVAAWALNLVFCCFVVGVAYAAKNLLVQSIVIRHERDTLVRELEQKNVQVSDALARVEESGKIRARVLATASHDLRQPLHALSLYSAVLAADPAPATLQEVSGSIDKIVRSLGHLLNGLLDLSRLSAGYFVPDKRPFWLDQSVREVCTEYQARADEKGLLLVFDLHPFIVRNDLIAVSRITRNLLDNAIKYTEQGRIHVATHMEGNAAILSITDTGKGIPLSEQTRVFEEFYQIDNPGRDRSKGVGLGLAIVQRLCELIDADISLDSEPGRGTCLRVTFRGQMEETVYLTENEEPLTPAPLNGKRVYVIDDESDILMSMKVLLEIWGMVVSTADTPAAAEQLFLRDGVPDLLIVDLRLGQTENGAQLARRMQLVYGAFPVLVMTGETSSEALRQANEQAYPLLQKPIAQEVLREAISGLLKQVSSPAPVGTASTRV